MNEKTTKTETAAEVLAEMRQQTRDGWTSDGRLCQFADRIERALSAQGETGRCKCPDCGSENLGCYNSAHQLMACNDCGQIIETELGRMRRLSAQGEAVAWAQFEEGQLVGTSFDRDEECGCTVPPYTHPATAPATHPDDLAVDRFAAAMKKKLAAARAKGRGGWDDKEDLECHLSNLLRAHVEKGDPRDVANFCCFLWNRGESIQPAPARVTEDDGRQAFEKWAAKRWALSLERWHDSGEYKSGLTRDWWQCWTESRAALTAALEDGRHG